MNRSRHAQPRSCDAQLVAQARAGSRAAFDRLVRAHRPALIGAAYVRTGNVDLAEDLTQEVLTQAWRKLPTLEAPGAFHAWLRTIAANVLANSLRRDGRRLWQLTEQPDDLTPDPRPTPAAALLAAEARQEIAEALAGIPEANRLALLLHELDGQPYDEIARLAGVPPSTVDGRIRRAKAALRRALAPEERPLPARPARPQGTRRKPMVPDALYQANALVLFTERLATLLEAGCPLARALDALRDTPASYGEASAAMGAYLREAPVEWSSPAFAAEDLYLGWLHDPECYPKLIARLNQAIEQKESLLPVRSEGLSAALARHPGLFVPLCVEIVRCGDSAGLLDAAVRQLATLSREQASLANRRPAGEAPVLPMLPNAPLPAPDWSGLTSYQQLAVRILLLRSLGAALGCGVPILRTMGLIAGMFPAPQAEAWRAAADDIRRGDPIRPGIERAGIFPPFVVELLAWGEEAGTLDAAAARAADQLLAEADASGA